MICQVHMKSLTSSTKLPTIKNKAKVHPIYYTLWSLQNRSDKILKVKIISVFWSIDCELHHFKCFQLNNDVFNSRYVTSLYLILESVSGLSDWDFQFYFSECPIFFRTNVRLRLSVCPDTIIDSVLPWNWSRIVRGQYSTSRLVLS